MIKHTRRALLAGASAALAAPSVVRADTWPSRPIRCIVALPPGGGTDSTGRLAMATLQDALGVPVVVENKPGAGGTIGSDIVAKAAPDGYTIGIATSSSHAAAPVFRKDLPYDPVKSFTAVTQLGTTAYILIGGPSANAKDLPTLIAIQTKRNAANEIRKGHEPPKLASRSDSRVNPHPDGDHHPVAQHSD